MQLGVPICPVAPIMMMTPDFHSLRMCHHHQLRGYPDLSHVPMLFISGKEDQIVPTEPVEKKTGKPIRILLSAPTPARNLRDRIEKQETKAVMHIVF